jgi:hypothetical protein
MGKYALSFVGPSARGGGKGEPAMGVSFRRDNKTAKTSAGVNIRIGADALDELRWQAGDQVLFALDKQAHVIVFKRVPSGGFVLGRNGGNSKSKTPAKAVRLRPSTLFSMLPKMPTGELLECAWSVEENMLVVAIEPSWL